MDCLFVKKDMMKTLLDEGLPPSSDYIEFNINDKEGVIIPQSVIGEMVKKTGIAIKKTASEYEEIFELVGVVLPVKEERDAETGMACADAGDTPSKIREIPPTESMSSVDRTDLRGRLRAAASILESIAKDL